MRKLHWLRLLLISVLFFLGLSSAEIIGDCAKISADEIQSQRIVSVYNESATILSNGVCNTGQISVGDLANNLTDRGVVSFDLDSLRRDEIGEIVSVELDLSGYVESRTSGGSPFSDLGNFQVVVIDPGLFSGCHFDHERNLAAYSMTGTIVYNRSGQFFTPINVTESFRNAYQRRARRFRLRLQFSRETDSDNIYDAIILYESISLTVRYSSPPPPVVLESPPDGSIVRSLRPSPVLNWRSIPGVSSYYVQYSESRDFSSVPTYEVFTPSCQTGGFEDGKTYYWRVKRAGTEWRSTDSIWSFTIRVVPDMPWINTPPHGAQISRRRPTLVWNAVSYATSYELELKEGSLSGPEVFHVFPTTTSFACPRDLSLNKRYVWIIKACNRNRECSGPATGWFEVVLPAPETKPPIPKHPPLRSPAPPSAPVKPPVR